MSTGRAILVALSTKWTYYVRLGFEEGAPA
jgi:hypothetical protein